MVKSLEGLEGGRKAQHHYLLACTSPPCIGCNLLITFTFPYLSFCGEKSEANVKHFCWMTKQKRKEILQKIQDTAAVLIYWTVGRFYIMPCINRLHLKGHACSVFSRKGNDCSAIVECHSARDQQQNASDVLKAGAGKCTCHSVQRWWSAPMETHASDLLEFFFTCQIS